MKAIIRGKKYDTETAIRLADDEFFDGTNQMNHGRSTILYKTKKGNFFACHETCWQGEHDNIEPLTISGAKELYEDLFHQTVEYFDAFGTEPEEA